MKKPNVVELSGKYICLNHPSAKLALFRLGPTDFRAQFMGVEERALLPILATALSRVPRFCGHTKVHPWSVVHHLVNMVEVYEKLNGDHFRKLDITPGNYVMSILLHDAAEGVLSDIPTPMKNEVDSAKENAVLKALPWIEAHNYNEMVKVLDRIAVIAEARVYGQASWDWVDEAVDALKEVYGETTIDDLIHLYTQHLDIKEQYRHNLNGYVNDYVNLAKKYLGEKFQYPSDADLKYYEIDKARLYAQ